MSSEEVDDQCFTPIVDLPNKVEHALEEDEVSLFKMRAKLFRWAPEAEEPQWNERGTGDVQLLEHKTTKRIRLLMRRDKTYKTCANHYLDRTMRLDPKQGSERVWMWTALADFAEEKVKKELFAIRFLNAENADKFRDKFCECQKMLDDIKVGQERFERCFNKQTFSADEKSSSGSEGENEDDGKKGEMGESDKKKEPQNKGETVVQKLEELSVKDDGVTVTDTQPSSSGANAKSSLEDSPEK